MANDIIITSNMNINNIVNIGSALVRDGKSAFMFLTLPVDVSVVSFRLPWFTVVHAPAHDKKRMINYAIKRIRRNMESFKMSVKDIVATVVDDILIINTTFAENEVNKSLLQCESCLFEVLI